jgi:hypothetical protein
MPTGKWMMHIELTCGSIEYVGETLPPETLGIVKESSNGRECK